MKVVRLKGAPEDVEYASYLNQQLKQGLVRLDFSVSTSATIKSVDEHSTLDREAELRRRDAAVQAFFGWLALAGEPRRAALSGEVG